MEKRTSKPEYAPFIVEALREGVVSSDELLSRVYVLMEGKLHPADLVTLPNGEPRWRNQATHMLDGLIEEGIVANKDGLLRLTDS